MMEEIMLMEEIMRLHGPDSGFQYKFKCRNCGESFFMKKHVLDPREKGPLNCINCGITVSREGWEKKMYYIPSVASRLKKFFPRGAYNCYECDIPAASYQRAVKNIEEIKKIHAIRIDRKKKKERQLIPHSNDHWYIFDGHGLTDDYPVYGYPVLENWVLEKIPRGIGDLPWITVLAVYECGLKMIPETVGKLVNLQKLVLNSNCLTALPVEVFQLLLLHILKLQDNQLSALPEAIGNLTELGHLDISGNKLTVLPDSIGNLTELSHFDISGNPLESLPETMGNLKKLVYLGLTCDRLGQVPEMVGNFQNLQEFHIGVDHLSDLPASLARLRNLNKLIIYSRSVEDLPVEISELP